MTTRKNTAFIIPKDITSIDPSIKSLEPQARFKASCKSFNFCVVGGIGLKVLINKIYKPSNSFGLLGKTS